MAGTRWPELDGRSLRYAGHRWELTGTVDVRGTGELIEAEARQADDVRHRLAILRFGLDSPPASLNPGALGAHVDRLARDDDEYTIVVEKDGRVYRYELQGLSYR